MEGGQSNEVLKKSEIFKSEGSFTRNCFYLRHREDIYFLNHILTGVK